MRHTRKRVTLTVSATLIWLVTGGLPGAPRDAAAAGESAFVPLTPCRLADTRDHGFDGDSAGPPPLVAGVPRTFFVQGLCAIPATATAVSFNVTATNTQGPGFLTLYPPGGAQPVVSTLNYLAGETVANAAIVPLNQSSEGVTVVAGVSGTDLILDVDGYFTDTFVHTENNNVFVGPLSGRLATTGQVNTAVGRGSLSDDTTGRENIAVRFNALTSNTDGNGNTAIGYTALAANTHGGDNIAIGAGAGFSLTSGDHNIYIGHPGVPVDNGSIRIGAGLQARAFMGGIHGVTTGRGDAISVMIDSDGQLGTVNSSRRVKTDIEPVGERSRGLHALRPVSFRYRMHPPDGPVEYGLIAEEVAEVYPDLVVRDAEGAPETVRYHLLPALLLSELQRLARELANRERDLQRAESRLAELVTTVTELAAEVARLKERSPIAAGLGRDNP